MPLPIVFAVPIILAAVLVASGLGSLLRGRGSTADWANLGVPPALRQPWMLAVHPWAEIALAVALLVTSGPLGWIVRGVAFLLMVGYLVLVVRAAARPDPVPCNCFGADPDQVVTWRTVWRNEWLVALSLVALLSLISVDVSTWTMLTTSPGDGVWWLVALAAAAVTVWLIADVGREPAEQASGALSTNVGSQDEGEDDELDYLRQRTPAVPVKLADGSTQTLRQLASPRALLILHVSETCGSCARIIEHLDSIRTRLDGIDVRLLIAGIALEQSGLASTEEPQTLHDELAWVPETFGYHQYPTAILLGADGLTAGGPVTGGAAVEAFIDDVEESLRQGRTEADL